MDTILEFLRRNIDRHLVQRYGPDNTGAVFLPSNGGDPLAFEDGKITLLAVKLEEEKVMRPDHLYRRADESGRTIHVHPELRLNLYLLFVANFTDYLETWKQLTDVAAFFQSNRAFQRTEYPDLPDTLEQLIVEMVSPSFSEQNEIWGALRTTYRPSALYKVRLIILQDQPLSGPAGEVSQAQISL